jgi:hypothetical protein
MDKNTEETKSMDDFTRDEFNILNYIKLISRLDENFARTLRPFGNLDFLSTLEIKKVIEGSIKMFREIDENLSGGLDVVGLLFH